MLRKPFLILSLSLIPLLCTLAQEIRFTATAPKTVESGEQFRVVFTINANGNGFKAPDLSAFSVLSGPNPSSFTSVQVVNGKMTQSIEKSFTFILLAEDEGKHTIHAAQISVEGKTFQSNPVTVEVVAGTGNSTANNQNTTVRPPDNDNKAGNSDTYVALHPDKTSAYLGEPILATFKVYTQELLEGFRDVKFPSFNGFWSHSLPNNNNVQFVRTTVNGKVWNVGTLQTFLIYPQKSGTLTIEPIEVEVVIKQPIPRRSFWDWGGYQTVVKKIKNAPKDITIKPLPGNKPQGFKGAVGKYDIKATISRNQLKANEALDLTIVISGSGNMKALEAPDILLPADFEIFEPQIEHNYSASAGGVSGSKTFNYAIIPRREGNFIIEPLLFSYFDPALATYKTLKTQKFEIEVEKGEAGSQPVTTNGNISKESIQYIGQDIRHIKEKTELHRRREVFYGSLPFWATYVVSLFAFLGIFYTWRNTIRRNADLAFVKNRRAARVSRLRLKEAAIYLKSAQNAKFYEALHKALWGYLGDKLGIGNADLNRESIVASLENRPGFNGLITSLSDLLDTCEFARFAPARDESQAEKLYQQAEAMISELENKLK